MSGRPSIPDGERGAALLAVLLLVAVMGAVSAGALDKLRLSTALAANSAAADQSRAFAFGLEALVALTVDDLTRGRDRTTLAGGWNGATRRYPMPGRGVANATVRDGGNCFNLNSVVDGDINAAFVARPAGMAQFAGLMRLLDIPADAADHIAAAAADWADSDGEPQRNGAEDSVYAAAQQRYRTANTLFAEPSELRVVAGMTPALYERVRPWICALPTASLSPININTLSPEQAPLLAMLDANRITLDRAAGMIAQRPESGWSNIMDFWRLPGMNDVTLPPEVQTQPQLRTGWFEVDLLIELDGSELLETALVDARMSPARIVLRRWGAAD